MSGRVFLYFQSTEEMKFLHPPSNLLPPSTFHHPYAPTHLHICRKARRWRRATVGNESFNDYEFLQSFEFHCWLRIVYKEEYCTLPPFARMATDWSEETLLGNIFPRMISGFWRSWCIPPYIQVVLRWVLPKSGSQPPPLIVKSSNLSFGSAVTSRL